MSKEHILKNGNSPRLLKYILEADNFDIEDYKLIVQNSVCKNHEYFIAIIKYKFHLEPSIDLVKYAEYCWRREICENIKFDVSLVDYYLDNSTEYTDDTLNTLIRKSTGNAIFSDNSLLERLLEKKYYQTVDAILSKYKCSLDEALLKKIFSTGKHFYYSAWKCSFDTNKTFHEYLKLGKDLSNSTLTENLHLFNTDEDVDEFIKIFNENGVKPEYNLFKDSLLKKNKQIIKLFFAIGRIYLAEKNIMKLINSNKDLWKYINLKNLNYSFHCVDFGKYYSINLYYDRLLEDIYKNYCRASSSRNNFKYDYSEALIIANIILDRVNVDNAKLETMRKLLSDGKLVASSKDLENFIDKFNELLDKYTGKPNDKKNNKSELPIISD
jgi:hypothetical protein